jgi:hypothetical protein
MFVHARHFDVRVGGAAVSATILRHKPSRFNAAACSTPTVGCGTSPDEAATASTQPPPQQQQHAQQQRQPGESEKFDALHKDVVEPRRRAVAHGLLRAVHHHVPAGRASHRATAMTGYDRCSEQSFETTAAGR